jgi:membrane-associated protease RseP (regulator of RpoE activity)
MVEIDLNTIYLIAGLVIFVAGTLLLRRTKAKRYVVFFMLETRHGLSLVDRIARLAPNLWKFLGDLAVVVSFGGCGSYYVARYRNTWKITGITGIACLVFIAIFYGYFPALAGIPVLAAGVMILRRVGKPFIHSIATVFIMGTVMFTLYPGFSDVEMLRPFMAVLVGVFGIPALLISLLFSQAFKIALAQTSVPGVSPLLPTVSSSEGPGFFFPGTGIFIPFWQALIAMICLLVPHEFAHGVLARSHKIKLKSAGLLTAGPVPIGAFVEPDEKAMKLHKSRDRMRIYAAGSFTNLLVAILSLAVLVSVLAPLLGSITHPTGMMVTGVLNGTPAEGVLKSGFVVQSINGMPTNDSKSFYAAVGGLKPGDSATFATTNGTFEITLAARPDNASKAYIGIDLQETFKVKDEFKNEYKLQGDAIFFITPTVFWIFFLSFNIALVNLLPIVPFDGGKMFEEIMQEFGVRKKRQELASKIVIALILALLILNASPLLFNLL